jgi:hypothetical protein
VVTPVARRRDFPLLKVPGGQFEQWQQRWADDPDRFIEKSTQRPLRPGGGGAAVHVELREVGGGVEIALVVSTPTGRELEFHELAGQLAQGSGRVLLDGQPFELEFPVSRKMLLEVFAKGSPVVPKAKVCPNLPGLIHHRLDLVRGKNVVRRKEKRQVQLVANLDGSDVAVHVAVAGCPLSLEGGVPPSDITLEKGVFTVTLYTSDDLDAVRGFASETGAEPGADGVLRMKGTAPNMQAFLGHWRSLPPSIDRRSQGGLAGLDREPQAMRPTVATRDSGPFIDATVTWHGAGGEILSHGEVAEACRRGRELVRTRSGSWLRLDAEGAAESLDRLASAGFDSSGRNRMFVPEAERFFATVRETPLWALTPDSRDLAKRIAKQCQTTVPEVPGHMAGILRHYQREGVDFLLDRAVHGVGPILADDMGLGKTVQVLAMFAAFARERGGRLAAGNERGAVVVCPASVVGVWLAEVAKFCPELDCRPYAGPPPERKKLLGPGAAWDILVVNYALLRNDVEEFLPHRFSFVVLDEAQQIKNPDALVTKAAKRLRTGRPVAMTGTPVENRVTDLWSIMDFLNPGFLGGVDDFRLLYDTPASRRTLSRRIAPVIMRRSKELVAPELPPKTEEIITVDMGPAQRKYYADSRG